MIQRKDSKIKLKFTWSYNANTSSTFRRSTASAALKKQMVKLLLPVTAFPGSHSLKNVAFVEGEKGLVDAENGTLDEFGLLGP